MQDGAEAISFLRHQGKYTEAPCPDLVVLDLNLPRRDGRQVLSDIKADPTLADVLLAPAKDILIALTPVLPKKAVGVGAYWMVSDRASPLPGFELLRYRLFKIEKMEKDAITFSTPSRRSVEPVTTLWRRAEPAEPRSRKR